VESHIILKVSLNKGEDASGDDSCLLATSTTIYSVVRIRLASRSRAAKYVSFSVSKTFKSAPETFLEHE
jgi:hypothetical protein